MFIVSLNCILSLLLNLIFFFFYKFNVVQVCIVFKSIVVYSTVLSLHIYSPFTHSLTHSLIQSNFLQAPFMVSPSYTKVTLKKKKNFFHHIFIVTFLCLYIVRYTNTIVLQLPTVVSTETCYIDL